MKERKFTFQATFSLLSLRWILNSLIKSFGNDDSGGSFSYLVKIIPTHSICHMQVSNYQELNSFRKHKSLEREREMRYHPFRS